MSGSGSTSPVFKWISPHCAITFSTGSRVLPYRVSEYSTRSNLLPVAIRDTTFCAWSSRNCSVKTFRLAPGIRRSNTPKRSPSALSAWIIAVFHFPPITEIVALIGQSGSFPRSFLTLCNSSLMGRWLLLHFLPQVGCIFSEHRRFADLIGVSAPMIIVVPRPFRPSHRHCYATMSLCFSGTGTVK
jgi:hypothetical protein